MKKRNADNKTDFIGVFSKSMLPNKLEENQSIVMNLDDGSGSHWTCIYNNGKHCEYFDSYGMPPPNEAVKFMKSTGKKISFSTSQIQKGNSTLCGYYCMYYINERDNNVNMYDIIYIFDQDMLHNNGNKNKNIIHKYFNLL